MVWVDAGPVPAINLIRASAILVFVQVVEIALVMGEAAEGAVVVSATTLQIIIEIQLGRRSRIANFFLWRYVGRKHVHAGTVREGGAGPVAAVHHLLWPALLGNHVIQQALVTLFYKGTAFVTQVVGMAVVRVWEGPVVAVLGTRLACG